MTEIQACLEAALLAKAIATDAPNAFVREAFLVTSAHLFDRAWALNEEDPEAPALDSALWH